MLSYAYIKHKKWYYNLTISIVYLLNLVFFTFLLTTSSVALNNVERVLSQSGIEAWLLRDHTNPIIAIDFLFLGGSALDPDEHIGLANMVSMLLTEGSGDLDSLVFQGLLEDFNISLYFSADYDSVSGHVQTLTENLPIASRMLKLAITSPRFDQRAIERVRSQLLAVLRQHTESPDTIAKKVWLTHVLPTNHPYSRPLEGTPESLVGIRASDLKTFVNDRFGRDNLLIAVSGDITSEYLSVLLDDVFSGLPDKSKSFSVSSTLLQGGCTNIIVKRDIPQSVVFFGHNGILRSSPDWYAALLVQHILGGGGFDSRLMKEIRELRGLAYSVSSTLMSYDAINMIIGHVATQNSRINDSITVIRSEWAKMSEQGPSAAEVIEAKAYLTGSWPLALDGTAQKAKLLLSMRKNNLGLDYLDKRNDYIQHVTFADTKMVASYLLQPKELVTVVVGQPQGTNNGNR